MKRPTLREYIERIINERDRLYDSRFVSGKEDVKAALAAQQRETSAAFLSSEKAIAKAEANAEKWRENANEWRAAMQDREAKFATRSEVDAENKSIRAEIQSLKESRAEGGGKAQGVNAVWAVLLGAIGAAGAVVALVVSLR